MTALAILAITFVCLAVAALPFVVLSRLDRDLNYDRTLAIGQARRDVLGERHGNAVWGWDNLDMESVTPRKRKKLQRIYSAEVDRLTNGRVASRTNRQIFADLSEQTQKSAKRHQDAMKELGD